jgi:hypothetical protein
MSWTRRVARQLVETGVREGGHDVQVEVDAAERLDLFERLSRRPRVLARTSVRERVVDVGDDPA